MKQVIALLFIATVLNLHGTVLTGRVTDTEGIPVDFASVRVLAASDSSLVSGATADGNGIYRIDSIPEGEYRVNVTCIGFSGDASSVTISSGESVATRDFILTPATGALGEVVVRGERFARTQNGLTVRPDKEQLRHSSGGYDLIRSLMIPGVSVNVGKGEVSALGGSVSLYIDGMPADYREVQQLRPADVDRIQYIDAPTGKYAGDNAALNFILKKRTSGGYVAFDALQRAGYTSGNYNLASKAYRGNTQYTLFAGTDYREVNGGESTRDEEIRFPSGSIGRDYKTDASSSRKNSQYAQLRVRNKNDRRTLRATFNFVRDAVPEDYNASSLSYTGLSDGPTSITAVRNSSSRNFKYSLGLSGSFTMPHGQFIEASASASASRNHYRYGYTEGSDNATSATTENYYNFSANFTYGFNFSRGNSLVFKIHEIHNVSTADYRGTHQSWQHLWSSETLCFAEYAHPLWGKASVRVSPGISAEFYRLHGMETVSYTGPRLQAVFAMQPSRTHFFQTGMAYGNSFPQLSMMSGATQQVDIIQQRRGNPDLKVTKIMHAMAVYGIGIGKVNLQALGWFRWAGRLPVSSYFFDNDMLVESYSPDGEWRQIDASVSATWTPSDRFNLQVSGGWLYNGYLKDADLGAACWKGSGQASWYVGDFALNARVETPQKIAGYNLTVMRSPWLYGVSVSWNSGALLVEAGADNPFSRHPVYKYSMSTPAYRFDNTEYSPTDRRSAYIKVAWSVDFGKKIKHDTPTIDRNIDSGILKAH